MFIIINIIIAIVIAIVIVQFFCHCHYRYLLSKGGLIDKTLRYTCSIMLCWNTCIISRDILEQLNINYRKKRKRKKKQRKMVDDVERAAINKLNSNLTFRQAAVNFCLPRANHWPLHIGQVFPGKKMFCSSRGSSNILSHYFLMNLGQLLPKWTTHLNLGVCLM